MVARGEPSLLGGVSNRRKQSPAARRSSLRRRSGTKPGTASMDSRRGAIEKLGKSRKRQPGTPGVELRHTERNSAR